MKLEMKIQYTVYNNPIELFWKNAGQIKEPGGLINSKKCIF